MPEPSRCPRCGAVFDCGARDAVPCWCVGMSLEGELLAALAARYTGCLCGECLRELKAGGQDPLGE